MGEKAAPADTGDAPEPDPSLRERALEIDGEEWIVREQGRTRSGAGSDAGAPLLYLVFARGSDPARPVRHMTAVGRALMELDDVHLRELWDRSKPHTPPSEPDTGRPTRSGPKGRGPARARTGRNRDLPPRPDG